MIPRNQGYTRARAHEQKARHLRADAAHLQANAASHERWAQRWRDWADDEYDEIPYPGQPRVATQVTSETELQTNEGVIAD